MTQERSNKTKTAPFRLLAYLLYGKYEWIETLSEGNVRIHTGDAARALRVNSADLWVYLYWLEQTKLISAVAKEKKKGTALITLRVPNAFKKQLDMHPLLPAGVVTHE